MKKGVTLHFPGIYQILKFDQSRDACRSAKPVFSTFSTLNHVISCVFTCFATGDWFKAGFRGFCTVSYSGKTRVKQCKSQLSARVKCQNCQNTEIHDFSVICQKCLKKHDFSVISTLTVNP